MNKLISIAIALAGVTTAAVIIHCAEPRIEKDARLAKKLNGLRDDLELDCDLIFSATKEIPEEIITSADRSFKEIVDDAADFATSIFNVYAYLDYDCIKSLSVDAKQAYVECISSIIKNAEKYLYAIDAARDLMKDTRRSMGIKG